MGVSNRLRAYRYILATGAVFVATTGLAGYMLHRYARVWHTDIRTLVSVPYARSEELPSLVYVEFDGVVADRWGRTHMVELAVAAPDDPSCEIQAFVSNATGQHEEYVVGSRHTFSGRIESGRINTATALDCVVITSDRLMLRGKVALAAWGVSAIAFCAALVHTLVARKRRSIGSGKDTGSGCSGPVATDESDDAVEGDEANGASGG